MPQTPSTFIGRLSKKGDSLAMWEYKLKIYASSIRCLYVLQGNEPCPNLPSLIPEPKFLGSRMDPEASTAFAKDHRKWKARHREELAAFEVALQNQKTWQQVDAQLLMAIIKSINDKLWPELLTVDRTSAAALKLIKSKYSPPQDKSKNPPLEAKDETEKSTKDKGKAKKKSE